MGVLTLILAGGEGSLYWPRSNCDANRAAQDEMRLSR
jgi:hypothetical protein